MHAIRLKKVILLQRFWHHRFHECITSDEYAALPLPQTTIHAPAKLFELKTNMDS